MSRRTARKYAFELIFEFPFHDMGDTDFLIGCRLEDENPPPDEVSFIKEECAGVLAHTQEIDKLIAKYSEGWKFDRLSKMDLAIMRLSAWEMLYSETVPARVSINEAVELAKTYGTDDSAAFVNGILGKIAAVAAKKRGDGGVSANVELDAKTAGDIGLAGQ